MQNYKETPNISFNRTIFSYKLLGQQINQIIVSIQPIKKALQNGYNVKLVQCYKKYFLNTISLKKFWKPKTFPASVFNDDL